AGDLLALLESRDPDLVADVKRRIAKLKEKFEAAIKPEKDAPSFKSVDQLFKKVAEILGGEKVNARMPATARLSQARAEELRVKAYSLTPAEATSLVEPFLKECEDIQDQARKLQADFDRFKDFSKRTAAMLERLISATATRKVGKIELGKANASALLGRLK